MRPAAYYPGKPFGHSHAAAVKLHAAYFQPSSERLMVVECQPLAKLGRYLLNEPHDFFGRRAGFAYVHAPEASGRKRVGNRLRLAGIEICRSDGYKSHIPNVIRRTQRVLR